MDFVQVQTSMNSRSFMFQLPDQGTVIYLPTRDGVGGPTGAMEISSPLPPAFDLENLSVNSKDTNSGERRKTIPIVGLTRVFLYFVFLDIWVYWRS